MAALKYQPGRVYGSIFSSRPDVVTGPASIQVQSQISPGTEALILSRTQKTAQSEELCFQQLARHLTISRCHEISPAAPGALLCWNTRGVVAGWL